MSQVGGYFVVISSTGLFWDGQGWGPREVARCFSDPPDAYADCALAVSCLRKLGVACEVGYVPRGRMRASRTPPERSRTLT
jgi:hypothetical protein